MTTATLNALECFEKLKAAGMPEAQAKVHVEVIQNIVEDKLVTKAHLDIRLAELKHDLLRWIIGAMLAQTALLVGIMAFMK